MSAKAKGPPLGAALLIALAWTSLPQRGEAAGADEGQRKMADYEAQLASEEKQVFALEERGEKNRAAHQILAETDWLIGATHDDQRIANRLEALRAAIADPANLTAMDEQSPEDGSWGRWYTEWFFKLDASYDQISELAGRGEVPKYPTRFLDRINSPEKLTAHLEALLISDRDPDGVDHGRELNETISDLLRLVTRDWPKNYAFHPQLKQAFLDFLMQKARNPETGYWGPWYRRDGRLEKTDNLSVTFHIVSFLNGDVPDWPRIIDTTLAIKDKKYPNGWLLRSGAYLNHNNMDVAEIFRLGWPQASPAQRAAMRKEIRKMLDWCVHDSLQADGSFKIVEGHDDSVETSIHFGASFLAKLGYFDRAHRFWTDEDFPDADKARRNIVQFIRAHLDSGGEGGVYYRNTLEELGEKSR